MLTELLHVAVSATLATQPTATPRSIVRLVTPPVTHALKIDKLAINLCVLTAHLTINSAFRCLKLASKTALLECTAQPTLRVVYVAHPVKGVTGQSLPVPHARQMGLSRNCMVLSVSVNVQLATCLSKMFVRSVSRHVLRAVEDLIAVTRVMGQQARNSRSRRSAGRTVPLAQLLTQKTCHASLVCQDVTYVT